MKILEISTTIQVIKYFVKCTDKRIGYAKEYLNLKETALQIVQTLKKKTKNEENNNNKWPSSLKDDFFRFHHSLVSTCALWGSDWPD